MNMSLTIPNLVPQRPFCYLNFISVAKPQKIGNETYDAHMNTIDQTYSWGCSAKAIITMQILPGILRRKY